MCQFVWGQSVGSKCEDVWAQRVRKCEMLRECLLSADWRTSNEITEYDIASDVPEM